MFATDQFEIEKSIYIDFWILVTKSLEIID